MANWRLRGYDSEDIREISIKLDKKHGRQSDGMIFPFWVTVINVGGRPKNSSS